MAGKYLLTPRLSRVPEHFPGTTKRHRLGRLIGAWITLGLAIIAGWRSRHGRAVQGPGFVSGKWLAEYRTSHISDPDW